MQMMWITYTLLASFAATALAINCYSCESTYDPHCGDNFEMENYWKLDCARVAAPRYLLPDLDSKNATACMKKIYEVGGERRVMRSCFYGEVNNTSVGCRTDPALMAVTEIDCLVCADENYCNAAHRAWPGKTAIKWSPLWAPTLLAMLARLNL